MKSKKISIVIMLLTLAACTLIFHINITTIKNIIIHSPCLFNLYIKLLRNEKPFDDEHVITSLDNGMPIIVNKYDCCVCYFIRLTGHWDSNEARVINKLVKQDFKIIEVGANFGVHTLNMARLSGKGGKIYAFEGNPKVSKYLKKSVEMNSLEKKVIVYQKAAGEFNGDAFLHVNMKNIGGGYLVNVPSKHDIKTEVVRLDDILGVQKIDLIKIDAEGYEARILKGASKILAANPDVILCLEWNYKLLNNQGTDHIDFANSLKAAGFKLWRIGNKLNQEPPLIATTYDELIRLNSSDIVLSRNDIKL